VPPFSVSVGLINNAAQPCPVATSVCFGEAATFVWLLMTVPRITSVALLNAASTSPWVRSLSASYIAFERIDSTTVSLLRQLDARINSRSIVLVFIFYSANVI